MTDIQILELVKTDLSLLLGNLKSVKLSIGGILFFYLKKKISGIIYPRRSVYYFCNLMYSGISM
jgi:hypothetical protein